MNFVTELIKENCDIVSYYIQVNFSCKGFCREGFYHGTRISVPKSSLNDISYIAYP